MILKLLCMYSAAAKPLQSFPTLCDPIDGSPLGSAVSGIRPRGAAIGRLSASQSPPWATDLEAE